MSKVITDITPFTLLDYPDKTACILWFAGCNMRCPYCYNPEIVNGKGKIEYADVSRFLKRRIGLLDGVVCSGGECTLHKELFDFVYLIKSIGLQVKIDTNGSRPDVIRKLVSHGLVDYISLDFKALPECFMKVSGSSLYAEFDESLQILLAENANFEVRTTVHSKLISAQQLEDMATVLLQKGYKGNYYIQHFSSLQDTLGKPGVSDPAVFRGVTPPSGIEFRFRN